MKLQQKKFNKFHAILLATILFIVAIFCVSCSCDNNQDGKKNLVIDKNTFSVNVLSAGNNDCTIISFGDGNVFMIDCGGNSESNLSYIKQILDNSNITEFSLVISHVDEEIIGNSKSLLETYKVNKVYIPDIRLKAQFSYFNELLNYINESGITTQISNYFCNIIGENYKLYFLTPKPYEVENSIYSDIYLTENPTETQKNNLSPIIYLEYQGIRFLFTGRSTTYNEEILLNTKDVYTNFLGYDIDFEKVDFLKVANFGGSTSTSQDFLTLIKPKNAIISVGGGYAPADSVLKRLLNMNIPVYRTDVYGNIIVKVADNKAKILFN